MDHLTAAPVLIDYLRATVPSGSVIVSPDTGRVKVAERYAKRLSMEVASIYKRRSLDTANEVEALGVMGDVDGRVCVIIDDIRWSGDMFRAWRGLCAWPGAASLDLFRMGIWIRPDLHRPTKATMRPKWWQRA